MFLEELGVDLEVEAGVESEAFALARLRAEEIVRVRSKYE